MSNALEPFEADEAWYRQACNQHGIAVDEDNEERFCCSVSHRVVDGGCSDEKARDDAFFMIHGVSAMRDNLSQ